MTPQPSVQATKAIHGLNGHWRYANYLTGIVHAFSAEKARLWREELPESFFVNAPMCQYPGCTNGRQDASREFGITGRHHCRRCGHTVCNGHFKEVVHNVFGTQLQLANKQGKQSKLCAECYEEARQERHELFGQNLLKGMEVLIEPGSIQGSGRIGEIIEFIDHDPNATPDPIFTVIPDTDGKTSSQILLN